jgi:triosephosphate isomerase
MRKKIVAGNWKMNLDKTKAESLTQELVEALGDLPQDQRVMVCPPSIHLSSVAAVASGSKVLEVGGQNMHQAESGAYTGEISGPMLKSYGIHSVLLGHSERRAYFHEGNDLLRQKVDAALASGIEVVYCFGEMLEERENDTHFQVVSSQLKEALFHLEAAQWQNIVLAYEPVWAIGTGRTASPEQAQEMHAHIRGVLTQHYGQECADGVSILYGGSVKPDNAREIFGQPDVDGGLIGGASLKKDDFMAIVAAMS